MAVIQEISERTTIIQKSADAMRQERKKANDRFGDALYYIDGQTIRRKDRQQLTTAYKQP